MVDCCAANKCYLCPTTFLLPISPAAQPLVLPWLRREAVANCFDVPCHCAELLGCQVLLADLNRTSRVPRPVSSVQCCNGCRQPENGRGPAFLAVAGSSEPGRRSRGLADANSSESPPSVSGRVRCFPQNHAGHTWIPSTI